MAKPPKQKTVQKDYVQTAVRLPPELNNEIAEAALRNGRSKNAEIFARLQQSPFARLEHQNSEIKSIVREILDLVRDGA